MKCKDTEKIQFESNLEHNLHTQHLVKMQIECVFHWAQVLSGPTCDYGTTAHKGN